MAIKLTLLISIINLASTFVSMALIDRYGRKSLLISAEVTMAIFAFLIPIFDSLKLNPIYIVLCLLMFVFGFGLGLGSIPWLIVPEIIPGDALDVSSSLSSGANWMFNFILALIMPILIHECNFLLFNIYSGLQNFHYFWVLSDFISCFYTVSGPRDNASNV